MEKQKRIILTTELMSRIPYGVYVHHTMTGVRCNVHDIKIYPKYDNNTIIDYNCVLRFWDSYSIIDEFKLVLRPMNSMTNAEIEMLSRICWFGESSDDHDSYDHRGIEIMKYIYDPRQLLNVRTDFNEYSQLQKFLLSHHLDYNGLIEMDLAVKAKDEYFVI